MKKVHINTKNYIFCLAAVLFLFLLFSCSSMSSFPGANPENRNQTAQTQKKPSDYLQEGIENFKNFKYPQAIQNFDKVLKTFPEHQGALFYRGRSLVQLDKPDQAMQDFNKILNINTKSAEGHAGRGEVYIEKKAFSAAHKEIDKSLASDRNLALAWYLRGVAYGHQNSLDKAIEALEQCLHVDSKHAYAHYQLGLAYKQKGRTDLAVIHLEKFLELAPNAPEADRVRKLLNKLS